MIFRKESMTNNWPGWASGTALAQDIYNYLHQYDNRFTVDNVNYTVDFDGKFKIKVDTSSGYRPHLVLQCSDANDTIIDTQPTSTSRNYWWEAACNPLNVIFLDSTDFIYLIIWPKDQSLTSTNNIGFAYIKTSDNKYYAQTLNPGVQAVDGRPFYNVVTASPTGFNLSPFINFAAPSDEVYLADKCILLSSTVGDSSINTNLLSCSTMTYNQVITVRGKNYYTVGTHTLAPLDNS